MGYVGLVQAAVLAEVGHSLCCVDIDEQKIAQLKQGSVPVYEPGLEALVQRNYQAGRLTFTTSAQQGVAHSQVLFIAVGTPADEDGSADLQHVLSVAAAIATHLQQPSLIVVKSTVPVGTCDRVRDCIARRLTTGIDFEVASNPEFLKEGGAVNDCMRPDRIIIGSNNAQAETTLRELYAPFNRNHDKILVMDVRSAELTKYVANAMLATKISFINEMANLAQRLGADIESVRQGIGADPRIGYHFIYPGCGYGGSCFPKDIRALIHTAEQNGFDARVLKAVEQRNLQQKQWLMQAISGYFNEALPGKTLAIWGLAFKPNTDDMRDAPSLTLLQALWSRGVRTQAYDPQAMNECRRRFPDQPQLVLCDTKEQALQEADALVILTEWQVFRAPNFALIKASLTRPVIFDGRNLYSPQSVRAQGFEYFAVGR